jgi:branched-chain amino acid transport system permease protein
MMFQIANAVLLGGYYALIAVGLAFMLQVMKVINLAHGSLAILAAYAIWVLADRAGITPFAGVLIVVAPMAAVGWGLQRLLLERSTRGGELLPILTTFGLAIVLDNLMFQMFGADTRSLSPYIGDLAWAAYELPFGLFLGKIPVWVLLTAVVAIGALQLLLARTSLGRRIRATAQDPVTASLVGVDARRTSAMAAALAMVAVALSGMALGLRGTFDAYAGAPQLLFAFEATIIGGARNLWFTLVGAMILALAQTFGAMIHPQGFLLGGHLAFLAVLFARLGLGPFGLSGLWQTVKGART